MHIYLSLISIYAKDAPAPIINNNQPIIKLVNFGSEDLAKILHNVFIDTIRYQGPGLYNKAIEGIHFNKEYPENQNIYISDFNRD